MNETYNLYDIVLALNGDFHPSGISDEINYIKYRKLKNVTGLVEKLLKEIREVSNHIDSESGEVRRMAVYAMLFLEDIKGDLSENC